MVSPSFFYEHPIVEAILQFGISPAKQKKKKNGTIGVMIAVGAQSVCVPYLLSLLD